jgi:molybdopterin-containing oxidoreductase family iron-sulfur binding subunit
VSAAVPEYRVRSARRNPVERGMYDARHATHRWAMAVDLNACTGCSSCVVACHAENNVPMVGSAMVDRGRELHWIRIERFDEKLAPGSHDVRFVPMMCQHCSDAPCEVVCPVYATYHNPEGLNVQVYNRCVGTRFCESNCPYKVRRFNFFGYADGQEYAHLGADTVKAAFNPDVTVRARGVMEKCTYCVQRISRARRSAEKEDRTIRDGEVITACQAACPTRAIHFGNLKDAAAEIHALRAKPESYALLGHLGTRPRTTYLARLRNPNPEIDGTQS